MKNVILIVSILVALVGTSSAQATRVIGKWAPASLAIGKTTVGAEYDLMKKNSVEIFVGIPTPSNRRLEYDGQKSNMESKAFSVFAGYRKYFGKKQLSGFYVEPFAKYLKHEGDGILDGDLGGEKASFKTITKYEAFGAGVQLGAQFIIAKRFALDLFFLGPEANSAKFSGSGTDIASSIPWTLVQADEAENDIRNFIADIPIVGTKTEITVDQNQKTISADYKGFLPGIRFGASIGVRL